MEISAIYLYEMDENNRLIPAQDVRAIMYNHTNGKREDVGKTHWGQRLVIISPHMIRGFMQRPIPFLMALEVALFYGLSISRQRGHTYEIADMELGQYNETGYILRVAFERRH